MKNYNKLPDPIEPDDNNPPVQPPTGPPPTQTQHE